MHLHTCMHFKIYLPTVDISTLADTDKKENPGSFVRFFRFWFPDGTTAELFTILSLGWPTVSDVLTSIEYTVQGCPSLAKELVESPENFIYKH